MQLIDWFSVQEGSRQPAAEGAACRLRHAQQLSAGTSRPLQGSDLRSLKAVTPRATTSSV